MKFTKVKKESKERFLEKVTAVTECGCWLWLGALYSPDGYGAFVLDGKVTQAHRAAWRLFVGAIPSDKNVLHTCDVKSCVNPSHLYLGTQRDNLLDSIARGQFPVGDRHWKRRNPDLQCGDNAASRKLAATVVEEIRASNRSRRELASKYGVSTSQIGRIIRGENWRHVQE